MNTFFYGYGNINGLIEFKEDPETLGVEIFYDPVIKKEVIDQKKTDLWDFSNRAAKERLEGIVFRVYLPDDKIDEIKALKEQDPIKALRLMEKYSTSVEIGTLGMTEKVAQETWEKICNIKSGVDNNAKSNKVESTESNPV